MTMRTDLYQGHDYYLLDELLTEEHKLIRETAREWVKKEVSPIIEDAAEKCEFPRHLLPGLGEIGAFGPYIPAEYGGPGLDQISYGIIMQELERCDSGLRSTASVQSSLVMYPIWRYGTEEQKQKYLPKLATGEMMGCFGLTEPDHGSNPGGMTTNFKEDGDDSSSMARRCGFRTHHSRTSPWCGPKTKRAGSKASSWSAAWRGSARRPCTASGACAPPIPAN